MFKKEYVKQDALLIPMCKKSISFILQKKDPKIAIKFTLGGEGSYTDGKTIYVDEFPFVIEDLDPKGYEKMSKIAESTFPAEEVFANRYSTFLHEAGHCVFSSFNELEKFQEFFKTEFAYLKHKVDASVRPYFDRVVSGVAGSFLNALEDVRIERQMMIHFPGAENYFKASHIMGWKLNYELPSLGRQLGISLLFLLHFGLWPIYEPQLDPDVRDAANLIFNDCDNAANVGNPIVSRRMVQTLSMKIRPLFERIILENLKSEKEAMEFIKAIESLIDFLNKNPMMQGEDIPKGGGASIKIKCPSSSGKASEGKGKGEGEGAGEGDGEDGEGKSEGKGKTGDKDKKSDSNPADAKTDKSDEPSYTKKEASSKIDWSDSDKSESDDSGNTSDNNNAGSSSSNNAPTEEREAITTPIEAIKAEIEKALEEANIKNSENMSIQKGLISKEEAESESITDKDLSSIKSCYKDDSIIEYQSVSVNVNVKVPSQIEKDGRVIRKAIEEFLRQQEAFDLHDQYSGRLNVKKLYRIGANDSRIFTKKGVPTNSDVACFVAWDGSGSMCGDKQHHSTIACAKMEEALKNIPLKIINFSVEGKVVTHYIVKEFNDVLQKKNYSYSYGNSRSFCGGNKDGYSIRVATAELLRRPEEKKVLFVLSDGAPSDYPYNCGPSDVKDAVKAARKAGVEVIAIFFGSEQFIRNEYEFYKEMYEKNIIGSTVENLDKAIIREIRKIFLSKN